MNKAIFVGKSKTTEGNYFVILPNPFHGVLFNRVNMRGEVVCVTKTKMLMDVIPCMTDGRGILRKATLDDVKTMIRMAERGMEYSFPWKERPLFYN